MKKLMLVVLVVLLISCEDDIELEQVPSSVVVTVSDDVYSTYTSLYVYVTSPEGIYTISKTPTVVNIDQSAKIMVVANVINRSEISIVRSVEYIDQDSISVNRELIRGE